MNSFRIGVLREGKIPPDKRVALSPVHCRELMDKYPNVSVVVQPSDIRCFTNSDYRNKGIPLQEDISDCDILFGVKEVPVHLLVPGKTYLFFSHTLKKQPQNKKLIQSILEKNITLIDYEVLTDSTGSRIIAFGRFAGIIGAYNALLLYGRKTGFYKIKAAHKIGSLEKVYQQIATVKLPPVKIVITGTGRVGKGSVEVLERAGVKRVSANDFLHKDFDYPVYVMLSSSDYNQTKSGEPVTDKSDFYKNPGNYRSSFQKFLPVTDILIAGAYWDPEAPRLFTRSDMEEKDFRIKVIADITCDIDGSVPTTIKPCTIYDPAYDYNPETHQLEPLFSSKKNITVMAIDNLPGELPCDASFDFGSQLVRRVIPLLLGEQDDEKIIERGTMTLNGKLTDNFKYLSDYAETSENTQL